MSEQTIRRFFDAMNAGDADAAAALVDPSIVLTMGPQRGEGVAAVRELATQAGPETLESSVDIMSITEEDGRFEVACRRTQRWAETKDIASEELLTAVFYANERGLLTRAELNPTPVDA